MDAPPSILILNGPNLNMLGVREPSIYGHATLDAIEASCAERAQRLGLSIEFRQTNSEGELVGWVQQAEREADALILNAAAFTHSSIALHDALRLLTIPIIEVHLSKPHARESFRHHSYVAPLAAGQISGFGPHGYELALEAVARLVMNGEELSA